MKHAIENCQTGIDPYEDQAEGEYIPRWMYVILRSIFAAASLF